MTDPVIAGKSPVIVELEAGMYSWCRCGLSKHQPFCDTSHRGATELRSLKFQVTEKKKVALCMCKHTANPPFCDGTHSKLG